MPLVSEMMNDAVPAKRLLLFLGGLALLVAFCFQGSRGLYESTEGRYAECARQSMEQGRLSEPVLNGENHWTKPPLAYYCMAAGMAVLGTNTWGVRIGLSVAFFFTVWAVYQTGVLMWGKRAGMFCGIVYAFSGFPPGAAWIVSTDTYLALWEALVFLFFWMAVRKNHWVFIVMMWISLGLAFLTKGFPAILCMVAPVATNIYLRRSGQKIPRFLNPVGLLLFIVIGFSWYIVKAVEHPGLLRYWVMEEGVGRNVLGEFHRNAQFYKPFTIYGPILLGGLLPWAGFLAWHFKRIPWPRGRWFRVTSWPYPAEWLFIVTGFFIPLVILCFSTSRLPMYVLPLFSLMALAAGKGLDFLAKQDHLQFRTVIRVTVGMALLLIAAKGVGAYLIQSPNDMERLAHAVKPILDRYPTHELHVLKQDPLYGLQFYLNRERIDKIRIEDAGDILIKAQSGTPQLTLVRDKHMKQPQSLIDKRLYDTIPINKSWTLIVMPASEKEASTNDQEEKRYEAPEYALGNCCNSLLYGHVRF
ncbi:MAG TPA: glycosyltransferase family 39 protein [Candidatus Hydrogenedentes bacterium]|nr:glycosyltransferase family 39 protein [Candidatus Hydrogenedentota bacterium]